MNQREGSTNTIGHVDPEHLLRKRRWGAHIDQVNRPDEIDEIESSIGLENSLIIGTDRIFRIESLIGFALNHRSD